MQVMYAVYGTTRMSVSMSKSSPSRIDQRGDNRKETMVQEPWSPSCSSPNSHRNQDEQYNQTRHSGNSTSFHPLPSLRFLLRTNGHRIAPLISIEMCRKSLSKSKSTHKRIEDSRWDRFRLSCNTIGIRFRFGDSGTDAVWTWGADWTRGKEGEEPSAY